MILHYVAAERPSMHCAKATPWNRIAARGIAHAHTSGCHACRKQPVVVLADDLIANPEGMLRAMCSHAGLDFDPAMLRWPAGPKPYDGVWASYWYRSVHQSNGTPPPPSCGCIWLRALAYACARVRSLVYARGNYSRRGHVKYVCSRILVLVRAVSATPRAGSLPGGCGSLLQVSWHGVDFACVQRSTRRQLPHKLCRSTYATRPCMQQTYPRLVPGRRRLLPQRGPTARAGRSLLHRCRVGRAWQRPQATAACAAGAQADAA